MRYTASFVSNLVLCWRHTSWRDRIAEAAKPMRRVMSVSTSLNLAFSLVHASTDTDCSCPGGATRRHQIGLLWERLSRLVDLELLFFAAAHERHTGACTYVNAGQSPLDRSIYLPQKWNCLQGGQVHYTDAAAGAWGIKWQQAVFSSLVGVQVIVSEHWT